MKKLLTVSALLATALTLVPDEAAAQRYGFRGGGGFRPAFGGGFRPGFGGGVRPGFVGVRSGFYGGGVRRGFYGGGFRPAFYGGYRPAFAGRRFARPYGGFYRQGFYGPAAYGYRYRRPYYGAGAGLLAGAALGVGLAAAGSLYYDGGYGGYGGYGGDCYQEPRVFWNGFNYVQTLVTQCY